MRIRTVSISCFVESMQWGDFIVVNSNILPFEKNGL